MNAKSIFKVVFLVILVGCIDNKDNRNSYPLKEIQLNLSGRIPDIELSNLIKESFFIKLQTTNNAIIGNINKVYLCNDTLFLSDGTSIYIFNTQGELLNKITRSGKGPFEYLYISDFSVNTNSKTIEIFCRGLKKFIRYDFNGRYIEDNKIVRWASLYVDLPNNKKIIYSGNEIEYNNEYKLSELIDYQVTKKFIKIDKRKSKYLHIFSFTNFSFYNDTLLFTESFNDTIYNIINSRVYDRYVIKIDERKTIPSSFFDKNYNYIFEFFNDLKKTNYAYGIFNFIESDSSLFFKYNICLADSILPLTCYYNKKLNKSIIFSNIIDDVNFKGTKLSFNDYNLFVQKNSWVIMAIPAYNFIEMFNASNLKTDKPDTIIYSDQLLSLYRTTKIIDNPILFIFKLR